MDRCNNDVFQNFILCYEKAQPIEMEYQSNEKICALVEKKF
jgi:hypothetical protein